LLLRAIESEVFVYVWDEIAPSFIIHPS